MAYFQWNNTFYKDIDSIVMDSPLSPDIANLYIEYFKTAVLGSFPLKPIGFVTWTTHLLSGFMELKH